MISIDLDRSEEEGLSSESDENMEVEDNTVFPPWSELPPHLTEKVYSFLDRHSQSNMSLVCRSWNKEYASPSLWRSMKFYLPEYEYDTDIYPEVRLARKYGAMFEHVEIICKRVHLHLISVIWDQLKLFLETLKHNSQLKSLKFINLYTFFKHLDDVMFNDLFEVIINLVRVQNNLQFLEFRNSQFRKSEAVDLLRIIFTKMTLKQLILPEFVREDSHNELTENTLEDSSDLECLMNLQEWVVDYSQIFENIMTAFYEYGNKSYCMSEKKWNLQKMHLFCDASRRVDYLGIASYVWKYVRKVCPGFQIDFIFQVGSRIRNDLDLFIIRYMPIRSLDLRWKRYSDSRTDPQIGEVLRHLVLCGINELLEELSIVWLLDSTNLASDFKNFLQVSPKLKVLQLYIQHPIEGLDALFKDWTENRPISLENVHITLANVRTMDDSISYSTLEDEFSPVLQVLGLNLILIVDSNWRPLRRGINIADH